MIARKNDGNVIAKKRAHPFRSAVLRGVGVLAPPLLTVLIFLWAGSTIHEYVIRPVSRYACEGLVWWMADIRTDVPAGDRGAAIVSDGDSMYRRMKDGRFVPLEVYDAVTKYDRGELIPSTARDLYRRYVEITYLRPYYVIPFVLSIFLLLLYLVGKSLSAGLGRFFSSSLEWGVNRVPVVRNVYSGVKQVSDFMFNERNLEFNRVVAVEFPRKGIWSIGFVTGESFLEIHAAANEPVLTVFIACSPMPISGFTVNCLKSECVDLNLTFDQACQFLISCGVIVPPHQMPLVQEVNSEPTAVVAAEVPPAGDAGSPST